MASHGAEFHNVAVFVEYRLCRTGRQGDTGTYEPVRICRRADGQIDRGYAIFEGVNLSRPWVGRGGAKKVKVALILSLGLMNSPVSTMPERYGNVWAIVTFAASLIFLQTISFRFKQLKEENVSDLDDLKSLICHDIGGLKEVPKGWINLHHPTSNAKMEENLSIIELCNKKNTAWKIIIDKPGTF